MGVLSINAKTPTIIILITITIIIYFYCKYSARVDDFFHFSIVEVYFIFC